MWAVHASLGLEPELSRAVSSLPLMPLPPISVVKLLAPSASLPQCPAAFAASFTVPTEATFPLALESSLLDLCPRALPVPAT